VPGKAHDAQGKEWLHTHGVDIAQRVGRGYLAEEVRIIHDGGEEVNGLHDGVSVTNSIDGAVVGAFHAYQHMGVFHRGQGFQCLGQILRPDLARSAALPDKAGKAGIAAVTA
jgi:hypothetical protein